MANVSIIVSTINCNSLSFFKQQNDKALRFGGSECSTVCNTATRKKQEANNNCTIGERCIPDGGMFFTGTCGSDNVCRNIAVESTSTSGAGFFPVTIPQVLQPPTTATCSNEGDRCGISDSMICRNGVCQTNAPPPQTSVAGKFAISNVM